MLPTLPIMLKVPYSSLYLLFGTLKWAQFIYITFLLWKRPEGRISDILIYSFFFSWCFLKVWWGPTLYIEMTDLFVRWLICPLSFVGYFGLLNQVVFNVLKNPNPLKDDEASALLVAVVLVLALFWGSSML